MDRDKELSKISGNDSTIESCSDQELVLQFKKGNENGFDELVRRYQTRVYQVAWRMVHNQEDAWDLAQETFVRAYRALHKFKGKSSFYTWLYRICFNLSLTFLKKHKQDKNISSLDMMNEETLVLEPTNTQHLSNEPSTIIKRQEMSLAISNALKLLPAQQRVVFMMRQYDQLQNEEIGQVLNLSVGGVKSNYHHAVKKLQELLKEWL